MDYKADLMHKESRLTSELVKSKMTLELANIGKYPQDVKKIIGDPGQLW